MVDEDYIIASSSPWVSVPPQLTAIDDVDVLFGRQTPAAGTIANIRVTERILTSVVVSDRLK